MGASSLNIIVSIIIIIIITSVEPKTQGAEESCLTVMLAQFIAQIDLVIQNNERD